jgi:hypothetical protein
MKPLAATPVRIARPSHDLRAAPRCRARNPYWDRWGITIADPDGYRLVLSTLSWP